MIGETGERKSAVATPDGKSRKKKKKFLKCLNVISTFLFIPAIPTADDFIIFCTYELFLINLLWLFYKFMLPLGIMQLLI